MKLKDYDYEEDKFIEEIFKKRFSVRSYLDKNVEFDKIANMLEAARWAPSAGNLQEIKYIITEEKASRKKISDACNQVWISSAPVIITVVADINKLRQYFSSRGENVYSYMDGAIVAEHLMLEATRLNLGTCLIGAFDEEVIKEVLSIPKTEAVIAIITVGYTNETERRVDRKNLNNKVFFEKYGSSIKNADTAKGNIRIIDRIKKGINSINKKSK